MDEIVLVEENTNYKGKGGKVPSSRDFGPSLKHAVFHNTSVEHVTIFVTDAEKNISTMVTLRKEDIPKWVNGE